MTNLNRVILTGRLTADPEVRYTTNELPVANFSLAINKKMKNGENSTEFVNCVAWRGLAKICGEYLKKGKLVAIEGRLQIRKYEGKDGVKRTAVEVIAENMQMLDSKFHKASSDSAPEEEFAAAEPVRSGKKK